jgi:hypothetical protein
LFLSIFFHSLNSFLPHSFLFLLLFFCRTQYHVLDIYSLLQGHIGTFGEHLDLALRLRAKAIPWFHELAQLLTDGDKSITPIAIDGCDGFGGQVDACGVCRGDSITCSDCSGEVNGGRLWDVCAVCGDGKVGIHLTFPPFEPPPCKQG